MMLTTLTGCCIFRKTVTTETVTVHNVDTIIQVKHDTIRITKTVNLTDTLFIETVSGKIVTYIDTTVQKIVTTFTGNVFNIPANIPVKTITITETVKPKKQGLKIIDKLLIVLFLVLIFIYIDKRKNK